MIPVSIPSSRVSPPLSRVSTPRSWEGANASLAWGDACPCFSGADTQQLALSRSSRPSLRATACWVPQASPQSRV